MINIKDLINDHPYILFSVSVVIFFIVNYTNNWLAANLRNKTIGDQKFVPEYDVVHNNFEKVSWKTPMKALTYWIIGVCVVGVILSVKYKNPAIFFKLGTQYLLIVSILYALRATTFPVTHVVPPQTGCKNRKIGEKKVWKLKDVHSKEGRSCISYMFSGHTLLMVIAALMIAYYIKIPIISIIIALLVAISLYTVIASKFHYTSDVLVSLFLSICVFMLFPKIQFKK